MDFHQTALARRDDLVRTMYERGELRPQVSSSWKADLVPYEMIDCIHVHCVITALSASVVHFTGIVADVVFSAFTA